MRRLLFLLFALGCSEITPTPNAPAPTPGPTAKLDAGTRVDDAGSIRRDAGLEPDASVAPDAGTTAPVDCNVDDHEDWTLCASGPSRCEVKFTDGAGCPAVCRALSLNCVASFEDVEEACAADLDRAALECVDTGHQSDYCVCATETCAPDCTGRVCGSDGCGGQCGACAAPEVCDEGQCVMEDICASYPYAPAALLAERVGFGRTAIGGDPNRVYHVTTLADGGAGSLRAALESDAPYWIVFDVNGKITHQRRVYVRSNKTVDGRGRDVTVEGTLQFEDTRNVIVTDIALTNTLEGRCGQDGDVITIRSEGGATADTYGSRDLWFHHLELYDGGDGLFDIRGGSNITLSWTHLHTHKKAILASRTASEAPATGMDVTFHHNFFDRITLRGPQFLYGRAHYFNNYQKHWYEYGAGSLDDAQLYSESNVYEARPGRTCIPSCPDPSPCGDDDFFVSKDALVTGWSDHALGNARSVGDLALEDAVIATRNEGAVFDPSSLYGYVAEPATLALAARVEAEAGPRVNYCP